jgi:ABC-2 type transport system permease protein
VVAALLLSLLLAAIGGLIATATPRRGFAVAATIAVLIVSFTAVTTTSAIIGTPGQNTPTAARYANLGSPFSLVNVVARFILGGDGDWQPTTTEGLVFVAAYVVLLAACSWGIVARYAKVARG